jgi:hypothetical protein
MTTRAEEIEKTFAFKLLQRRSANKQALARKRQS